MFFYRARSAKDLIEKCTSLSLTRLSGRWYFRGQGDSTWSLLPSLLRPSNRPLSPDGFEKAVIENMRRVLRDRTTFSDRVINEDDVLLAMAQHYGVKTRLLDWTRDPYIALYFACSDALRGADVECVSVFALAHIYLADSRKASFVEPPRAANPNLAAQRGLLSKADWKHADLWDDSRARETTEPEANVRSSTIDSRLVRFDLSRRWVPDAMSILLARGVDASTLFPSEQGLTRLAEDLSRLPVPVSAKHWENPTLVLSMDGGKSSPSGDGGDGG